MISEIIDAKIGRIRSDLAKQGLTFESLQDDILDHVCCMVEEQMIAGYDFESSYDRVMSSIGGDVLGSLQHETLLLLDKKFQRMKSFTYGIGLAGAGLTIIGALFKTFHWPGAGILLVLGFILVAAVFLPLYFILSYREQAEKPAIIYPLIGYLTIAVVLVGTIFKIQHWPGANILLQSGIVIILIAFLPLFLVRLFKRSEGQKLNPAYIVMLLIGISIVLSLTRVNLSKDAIDYYTDLIEINQQSATILRTATTETTAALPDSMITDEISRIAGFSEELHELADEMLDELLATVGQSDSPIEEVSGKDFRSARWKAIVETGLGDRYRDLCKAYSAYLLETVNDPVARIQIRNNMVFASDNWIIRFEPDEVRFEPLVITYFKITGFDNEVAICENLAINALIHD
jgi:hypothetical protein